jgi:hypothetical protein
VKSSDNHPTKGPNHPMPTQPAQPGANIRLSSDGRSESSDMPRESAVRTRKRVIEVALPLGYVRQPFRRKPDFGVTSVNYDLAELIARAEVVE